ncbi:hypothetical protein F0225_09590, partial [Vibrio pectenicida]
MAIEFNQFTQGVNNNPLVLSDSNAGDPMVVTAQFGFAEKILQWISNIPLLSNLPAVKDFILGQTEENQKVLCLFINALAHEYSEEVANKIAEQMDLSGSTPLSARLVKQIMNDSIGNDRVAKEFPVVISNSDKPTEVKLAENVLIGYEATLASYLDERGKGIAEFKKTCILPMPSSLSYVSSFIYSETDSMQQLQKEVNNYNKLLKASALDDELQPLANLFDCPVSDSDVTKHLDTLSTKVTQLLTALKAVEHAFQNLTETERNHAKQFGDILSLEIDLISKNETLIDDYQAAWKTNSDG